MVVVGLGSVMMACASFSGSDVPGGSFDGGPSVSITADGASDAASAGDGGASGCTAGHSFCLDFDHDSGTELMTPSIMYGALDFVPSMPDHGLALRSTIPAEPAGTSAIAVYPIALTGSGIHLEANVYLAPADLGGNVDDNWAFLELSAAGSHDLSFYVRADKAHLAVYVQPDDMLYDATTAIPPGQWTHITIDASFGSISKVAMSVGGAPALSIPLSRGAPQGTIALRLGAQRYNGATPALDARYDDVLGDLTP